MYYRLRRLMIKSKEHFQQTLSKLDTTEKKLNALFFLFFALVSWYLTFNIMYYVNILLIVLNTLIWFIIWYGCIMNIDNYN